MIIIGVLLVLGLILFSSQLSTIKKIVNKSGYKTKIFIPLIAMQLIGIILMIFSLIVLSPSDGEGNYYAPIFFFLPGFFWFFFFFNILRIHPATLFGQDWYLSVLIGYCLWLIPGYLLAIHNKKI